VLGAYTCYVLTHSKPLIQRIEFPLALIQPKCRMNSEFKHAFIQAHEILLGILRLAATVLTGALSYEDILSFQAAADCKPFQHVHGMVDFEHRLMLFVQALLRLEGVVLGGAPSFQGFLELFRPLQDALITQLLDRHAKQFPYVVL